ncbi:MAG: exo-alpha-sialidase [Clostridia bacterium]|nr:exo-alpha-sialidase [Clostridia bacterium]
MEKRDCSLIPPRFTYEASEDFKPEGRLWQSAPSAAQTKNGRIFCVYSADNKGGGEYTTNYTICAYSDDNGEDYKLAFYAWHEHEVRISEVLLFMSPEGVLYHFWTQNYGYFDGRGGIWCMTCEDPDAPVPHFSEPRRICDGCMADNPVVLRDGRWLFPSSVWTHMESEWHPFPEYEKVSLWQSLDRGQTLTYLGGVTDPIPSFSENSVFETADGRLCMYFRTQGAISPELGGIAHSYSSDGGKTWTEKAYSPIKTPNGEFATIPARFMVQRFPSGALLLVTHHGFDDEERNRSHLTALVSDDDGKTFSASLLLDERNQVSYPSGNVTEDGRVILAYDRERLGAKEIMLASFTEEDIRRGSFGEGSYTKKLVSAGGKKFGV